MISHSVFKRLVSVLALAVLVPVANAQVLHGGIVITSPGATSTAAGSVVIETSPPAVVAPSEPGPEPSGPNLGLAIDQQTATGRFLNLSTRGWVSGTDKIMIAGLVVGEGGRAVLIRAVGPSLLKHNVTDFLPRPRLELRNSKGEFVTATAAWNDLSDADKAEARRLAQATGAFPLNEGSDDAVLFIYLEAGIYTCIVTGVDGSTGTALVECYEIPTRPAVMPSPL